MHINKFEDIIAWQKNQDFAVTIYKHFSLSKDFGFRDPIRRASVSISNNIAEGFDRMSNKEFIRFLYISLASCSEVKSMLYLSERLGYLDKEQAKKLVNEALEINKIIHGLIRSIENKKQITE